MILNLIQITQFLDFIIRKDGSKTTLFPKKKYLAWTWRIYLLFVYQIRVTISKRILFTLFYRTSPMRKKFLVKHCFADKIWGINNIFILYVGVSCFRQISIEKLTNRSENDEFSRSSVQKSVSYAKRLKISIINKMLAGLLPFTPPSFWIHRSET